MGIGNRLFSGCKEVDGPEVDRRLRVRWGGGVGGNECEKKKFALKCISGKMKCFWTCSFVCF